MNKAALVDVVASRVELTKEATARVVDETMAAIMAAVAGGDVVRLSGFGTFETRDRGPRTARNPRTGDQLRLSATTVLAFRPSPAFKKAVR